MSKLQCTLISRRSDTLAYIVGLRGDSVTDEDREDSCILDVPFDFES